MTIIIDFTWELDDDAEPDVDEVPDDQDDEDGDDTPQRDPSTGRPRYAEPDPDAGWERWRERRAWPDDSTQEDGS